MKPRGRPRLATDDTSVTVNFRLPSKQFDETAKQAQQARLTLPNWLRQTIRRALKEEPR